MIDDKKWPPLPYEKWKDTLDTLHMWMQIVGKVKLALHPFINQWWHVAFQVNSSGMTTGLIPFKDILFEMNFDFIQHKLVIHTTDDQTRIISLEPRTVADFYKIFMEMLQEIGISVKINTLPCEVIGPIHCHIDTQHFSYDKEYANKWWMINARCALIFEKFRSGFKGKSSPVNFFWGSFDLNETRYSGKSVSPPDGGIIMKYAENEENFSFGFWPGDERFPHPAFYSYFYPAPKGIESVSILPEAASFNKTLGEFILPYEAIYFADDTEKIILDFLKSTYLGSTRLTDWDVKFFKGVTPD